MNRLALQAETGQEPQAEHPGSGVRVAEPPRRRRFVRGGQIVLERYALVLATIAVFAFFTLDPSTSATFPAAANLRNVIGNQSVLIVVTLALLFPLLAGEFDFSVGAIATMSQIAVASANGQHHLPLAAALAIGIAIGFVVGCVNAFVVTRIGVSGIITTLGIGTLIGGLMTLYTHGNSIVNGISNDLINFGGDTLGGVPSITLCTVGLALLAGYVLSHTPNGRYLRAVGSNRSAATLVGLNVPGLVARSFVISGTLAGLAGALLLARNGIADPQVGGTTLTLQALSAAFLGATAIRPGHFNILGSLFAVLFIAFSVSGLSLAGAADWVNDVFTGTALVIAVAISTISGKRRQRHP